MAHEIKVPEVSEGVKEGIVAAIAVAVGDTVEEEQTLLELETDKAVVEIPSTHAGKVTDIKVEEGETVSIGAVIMLIEGDAGGSDEIDAEEKDDPATEEETAPVAEPESGEKDESAEEKTGKEEEPQQKGKSEKKEPVPEEDGKASAERPAMESARAEEALPEKIDEEVDLKTARRGDQVAPAAPSVRRKARELGVDIYRVEGSGPGGRISQADIRRYVRKTMKSLASGAPAPSAVSLPDFSRWGKVKTETLSNVRRLTAETMAAAWANIPMVAQTGHARISSFEEFRKEFNSHADGQSKLTMTAVLVKICAAALRHFPQFNSSLDSANNQLILKEYVHIGVAVDTPAGLLVPVLRDADKKDIETIAIELNDLAARARERKLKPEEMEGGCFTISNLGGIGRDLFTPIVFPPQVAILGVARGRHEPVWNGQDFVPEMILPMTLTYDHRVIDGADGARFMQWICQAVEYPLQLVMKG